MVDPTAPFHVHYTPTCSSWLNQVEIWFSQITRKAINRGAFTSTRQLIEQIEQFVANYNPKAKPFASVITADSIFEKLRRLCQRISGAQHYIQLASTGGRPEGREAPAGRQWISACQGVPSGLGPQAATAPPHLRITKCGIQAELRRGSVHACLRRLRGLLPHALLSGARMQLLVALCALSRVRHGLPCHCDSASDPARTSLSSPAEPSPTGRARRSSPKRGPHRCARPVPCSWRTPRPRPECELDEYLPRPRFRQYVVYRILPADEAGYSVSHWYAAAWGLLGTHCASPCHIVPQRHCTAARL